MEKSKHKSLQINMSVGLFSFLLGGKGSSHYGFFEWILILVYNDVYVKCITVGRPGSIIRENISGYRGSVIPCRDDNIITLLFSLIENQKTVKQFIVSSKIQTLSRDS